MKPRSLLATVFLLATLPACLGGTGTGNPSDLSNGAAAGVPASTQAGQIANAICDKLISCFPSANLSQCDLNILDVTNLGPALGLTGPYATDQYGTIIDAEEAGEIHPVFPDAEQCIVDIQALSCSSSAVTSAYDPSSSTDFSDVVNLPTTSTSCSGVYQ